MIDIGNIVTRINSVFTATPRFDGAARGHQRGVLQDTKQPRPQLTATADVKYRSPR